ncbi:SMP-30/gluconolactonase/LRE family protein [Rhodovulum sulfidophilum]|uniref:SMP-30/gluconolactonase/LRE family protein n=1 Tax=Rhodovulum sulfidophilum TaxID=35806 RepID=A0ABS1RZ96_RHOSU|nr:SMP-30/gluconolactonase/LRE family protein [Rhodovulum sulfidophilum]
MKDVAPNIAVAVRTKAAIGESPLWSARRERLLWIDIMGRQLHTYDPATGRDDATELPTAAGLLAEDSSGEIVLGLEHGLGTAARPQVVGIAIGLAGPIVEHAILIRRHLPGFREGSPALLQLLAARAGVGPLAQSGRTVVNRRWCQTSGCRVSARSMACGRPTKRTWSSVSISPARLQSIATIAPRRRG